ncbi:hypothetical protein ACF1AY_35235 [Streptomyces sp. NPDC014776]|uniref:hypothetical protein n=1 Tax=unclassified Streptomyces TaxID=2593676 RepID=UPI0036FD7986
MNEAIFTGIGWGLDSPQLRSSLASAALGVVTFGQSKWIGALGVTKLKGVAQGRELGIS